MTNRLARKVDAFVAVSGFTREKFCGWSGVSFERGHVLPNCIQLEKYGAGSRKADLLKRYRLEGRKVIMTLGRLSADERYKGIDEVLEVLPALVKDLPNLTYFIAGDGTDRRRLEQKVAALNLSKHVTFAGRISEEEKADHFRLADAFVMPGFGEGFGIVYLEAMACGIPVVASKADASREAVRDGELGIIVDPRNPEDLKAGILSALSKPVGKVPEGLDYFSFENFQRRLHGIVDQVLHSN
jgi:phosphatidylinositol alpha-1,6-mannosyltransferase